MRDAIHTKRLLLRPYDRAADRAALSRILGRFEVSKWLSHFHHPLREEDIDRIENNGFIDWPSSLCVEFREQFIGAVAIRPSLGYFVAPEFHGGGLGSEAVEAAVDFAFTDAVLDKIEAQVFDGNDESLRILEKLGFRTSRRSVGPCAARECRMRLTNMRLTRAEWEALQ